MYELIPLVPLALASLEDLKYKAVPDSINYFMLIFTYVLAVHLFLVKNIIPENITFAVFILIFFFIMYLAKFLAIGDLFLMLWLVYFLSFLNTIKLLEFLIFMFVSGFVIAVIYSIWILKKNNKKNFVLYISLILSVISLVGIWLSYKHFDLNPAKYFFNILLLIIAFFIYKKYECEIKELLVFRRSPKELVEGDWVCNPIKISKIPEELNELIRNYFNVERKDNKILLYPKDNLIYGSKGLSKSHIDILQKLYTYEKFTIDIREGFPLVPAIFLGYLLALLC